MTEREVSFKRLGKKSPSECRVKLLITRFWVRVSHQRLGYRSRSGPLHNLYVQEPRVGSGRLSLCDLHPGPESKVVGRSTKSTYKFNLWWQGFVSRLRLFTDHATPTLTRGHPLSSQTFLRFSHYRVDDGPGSRRFGNCRQGASDTVGPLLGHGRGPRYESGVTVAGAGGCLNSRVNLDGGVYLSTWSTEKIRPTFYFGNYLQSV